MEKILIWTDIQFQAAKPLPVNTAKVAEVKANVVLGPNNKGPAAMAVGKWANSDRTASSPTVWAVARPPPDIRPPTAPIQHPDSGQEPPEDEKRRWEQ